MFKAVQRLEIALRTKIIQEFSLAHGPFWFFDTSLADDEHKFIENMNSIDRELLEHWKDNDSKVVSGERNSFSGQLHYASSFPTPHAVED